MFSPFLPVLPEGIRATVVSYPDDNSLGYDELLPLVDGSAPDEPYVVLGESFSGPLALRHAAARPAGLRAVILVATFGRNPTPWGTAPLLSALGSLPFRARASKLAIRWLLTGFDAPGGVVDEVVAVSRAVVPRVMSFRLQEVIAVDVRDQLPAITVPVLYLLGTRDRIVGRRGLRGLAEGLEDLQVVEIDAPHLLLQSHPAQAYEAIAWFLREKVGVRSKSDAARIEQPERGEG